MEQLLENYSKYKPSDRCYLDGRYFNKVLDGYVGLVSKPMRVIISINKKSETKKESYEWEQEFSIDTDGTAIPVRLNPGDPELVRVIVEINRKYQSQKDSRSLKSRHSNLIIIDADAKRIMRFEPLKSHKYKNILNEFFERYFKRFLPDYEYLEIELHPQSIKEDDVECKDKGMCVAYVTKLAVLVALDKEPEFPSDPDEAEKDIKRFSAAIEDQFGPLTEGEPDIEYGLSHRGTRTATGAAVGAVLGGLALGSVSGALLGGAVGGAYGYYTTPYYGGGYGYYDPYYPPPVVYSRPYHRPYHHDHGRHGGWRGRGRY